MPALEPLVWLFVVALLLNLVWEFAHARLYATCRRMSLLALARLLTWQSIKDAIWITLAFVLSPNMYVFALVLLSFSFAVEKHAIKTKRWEYAPTMPTVWGVGLTPFVELAVTGLVSVFIVTLLIV